MRPEAAIVKWIEEATGLVAYQAPLRSGQERPDIDYCTFQMVNIQMPDYNSTDKAERDDDFITKTISSHAIVTLSLNVWSSYGYTDLIKLDHSAEYWKSRNTLSQGNVSINEMGSPQDLTGLGDTNYRDRWQMDATLFVKFENEYDWDKLKEWQINGRFTEIDESAQIDSAIKYPA